MSSSSNDLLSWTNQDPRESQLFNARGVVYRFQTNVSPNNGQAVTTLWRNIRPNREDRIAKLEWAASGGLGRIIIGKNTAPMSDLVRPDASTYGARIFNGPDGRAYRWGPSQGPDIVLQDPSGSVIAFFRPVSQTPYEIGDVFGELHFIRNAGTGIVTHPPMMDMVVVTAMLYRFCAQWNV